MEGKTVFTLTLVAATLLAALLASQALAQRDGSTVTLKVYPGGLVEVNYTLLTNGTEAVKVPLIGEPLESYGIIVVDQDGNLLAYDVNNTDNTLEIVAMGAEEVKVSYVTETLTSKSGDTWTINYTSPLPSTLYLPQGAVVTYISSLPSSANAVDDTVVLGFPPGPVLVQYIIPYPPPQQGQQGKENTGGTQGGQSGNTQGGTQTQTQPSTQPQKSQGEKGKPQEAGQGPGYLLYAGLGAAAVAAVAAALLLSRKRRLKTDNLSEDDLAILRALESLGGEAFQSDIKKLVDLPTTTLWRRIRRLERMGYVEVEKRYGRNYVRLK